MNDPIKDLIFSIREPRKIPDDFVPEILLIMTCTGEHVPEHTVGFLDISSDINGHDVITFDCPGCGQVHQSLRYG